MTDLELMIELQKTTPEKRATIERILCGAIQNSDEVENNRLLTITEACLYLNTNYPKFRRIMNDGLVDVVDATGRRMVREQSVIDFSKGLRKPSAAVLERREARNAARREAYRLQHPKENA